MVDLFLLIALALFFILLWQRPRGVWRDVDIHRWAKRGGVVPYAPALVNPCSLDLSWGCEYRREQTRPWWAFWRPIPPLWGAVQTADSLTVAPGEFVLLSSAEYFRLPHDVMAMLWGKSTAGRSGIEHLHAGIVEAGFAGELTLEIVNVTKRPITIKRGDRLVQLVFMPMTAVPRVGYAAVGRYQGQVGPQPARPPKGI